MPILVLGGECSFGTAELDSMRLLATDVCGGVVSDSGLWIPKEQPGFIREQFVNFFVNGIKATEWLLSLTLRLYQHLAINDLQKIKSINNIMKIPSLSPPYPICAQNYCKISGGIDRGCIHYLHYKQNLHQLSQLTFGGDTLTISGGATC